jgi:hypothetical protein
MIRGWRRVVDAATRGVDPVPLALFRVGVGLSVLVTIGSVGSAGLVDVLWVDASMGGYRELGSQYFMVDWLGGPSAEVMRGLAWAGMALGVLLTLGLGGRATALAALLTTQSLVNANPHAGGSYDLLLSNALWLCVLAPCTATLSADAWLRHGRPWATRRVYALWAWLVAYQIVLVYWSTGVQKVSAYWTPGGDFSALYYILQQPTWQRYPLDFFAWVFPLTQVATAVTWFWEVSAPLWLVALYFEVTRARPGWVRAWFNAWDVRTLYAVVGILFHVALLLTLNVGPFPLISLAYYACLWPGEEIRSWVGLRAASTA